MEFWLYDVMTNLSFILKHTHITGGIQFMQQFN